MESLTRLLQGALNTSGPVVFLTGLGLSFESNIPNFLAEAHPGRSAVGLHTPRDLARRQEFLDHPDVVWSWYLWRWAVCQAREPNATHLAIARAARMLGSRFFLITETVDGLHRQARTPLEPTHEVHGYLGAMRCARGCPGISHVPRLPPHPFGFGELTEEEREALVCVRCGGPSRPHVLWLDETYDEVYYRYDSALQATERASALIVIGSSVVTTLSRKICDRVVERGVPLIAITPELNAVASTAARLPSGIHLKGAAAQLVPVVVEELARVTGVAAQAADGRGRNQRTAGAVETILEVGAEGGCVTLQGRMDDQGTWCFRVGVDCSTFAELAPGEFNANELMRQGGWTLDFQRALEQLDREAPWARLHPLRIHPAFSSRVLDAVRARLGDSTHDNRTRLVHERWQELSERQRPR